MHSCFFFCFFSSLKSVVPKIKIGKFVRSLPETFLDGWQPSILLVHILVIITSKKSMQCVGVVTLLLP